MKRTYVVEMIANIVGGNSPVQTAELIVERLSEEGVLHLGYGNADIDKVLAAFSQTFGTTKVSRTDRFAANRLVMTYGADSIVGIIKLLGQGRDEPFVPVTNSVTELEKKIASVLNFLRKNRNDEVIET